MTILADRYELIDKLGEGGMGVVWRAHDDRLERDVAIKLLRPFVADEPDQRRRFDREAKTLAALSNDHIVRVFDYAESGDDAFLVMEYVEGQNLAASTFDRLPLRWSEVASYALPVCHALAYAHSKSVIHRDLTPANILLERGTGRVVATDFGLARIARAATSITATGVLIGTPEYWSPEQAMGRDNDGSTDMYALGCILFQLVTGRLPFEGDDRLAIGLRRAHEDAPSVLTAAKSLPADAATLVDSLLARDAARRPTATQAAAAIEASTVAAQRATSKQRPQPADVPSEAAPTALLPENKRTAVAADRAPTQRLPPPEPPRRSRRLPIGLAIGVAAAATVIAIAVATSGETSPPPTPAAAAVKRHPSIVFKVPKVVALSAGSARSRITRVAPNARVRIVRAYSTSVPAGHVIRQYPAPSRTLRKIGAISLTVSKGSPYAAVPSAGATPDSTKAKLAAAGFSARYRFMPSWNTGKGSVIGLNPAPGTQVRRPATISILISSGYPRTVVPDVGSIYLTAAESQLSAKHLKANVVYVASDKWAANQVLSQSPAAGTEVVQGTSVRLSVSREPKWVKAFSDCGSDTYQSPTFTVSKTWLIRYNIDSGGSLAPQVQFGWTRAGSSFQTGYFYANSPGGWHDYNVDSGAGTYRVDVDPTWNEHWCFEIYDLK